MQVTASSATYGDRRGLRADHALPTIASPAPDARRLTDLPSRSPEFVGVREQRGGPGAAGRTSPASSSGSTGTGVTVGVLSDSVSQFAGGLADSVSRPATCRSNVKVLQDGAGGRHRRRPGDAREHPRHRPGRGLAFATRRRRRPRRSPTTSMALAARRRRTSSSTTSATRRAVVPGRPDRPGGQHGRRPGRHLLQRGGQHGQRRLPVELPRRQRHRRAARRRHAT